MKIFKYRTFHQWAKAEGLEDAVLEKAVNEIENGLFEANLGSGLYKKRIARKGQGKRSSYRTLIALKTGNKSIFMYGFSKNVKENITDKEKEIYQNLAKHYLNATADQLDKLIKLGQLIEVNYEQAKRH